MYLFLTVVSLRCCAGFSLIACSLAAVRRLALQTSVAEHRPQEPWAAVAAARGHSSLRLPGSRAVGSVAVAHGPATLLQVGYLWTRDQTLFRIV